MAKPVAGGRRPKKKERKNVTYGMAHIKSSFNNTIITFTDLQGNTLSWASSGNVGLQGFAQEHAVRGAARGRGRGPARDGARRPQGRRVVKGPGSGRETAIRSIQNAGIEVVGIKDVTPIPHNGCRQSKRRRV